MERKKQREEKERKDREEAEKRRADEAKREQEKRKSEEAEREREKELQPNNSSTPTPQQTGEQPQQESGGSLISHKHTDADKLAHKAELEKISENTHQDHPQSIATSKHNHSSISKDNNSDSLDNS
jgi:hypothetical protein